MTYLKLDKNDLVHHIVFPQNNSVFKFDHLPQLSADMFNKSDESFNVLAFTLYFYFQQKDFALVPHDISKESVQL